MPDTRIERERLADLERTVDQLGCSADGGEAALLVATTSVTTYPTSAPSYYACHPTVAGGDETEGTAASYTADADQVIYAINLGTQIPPSGTHIVIHGVGGRWAFRYDG